MSDHLILLVDDDDVTRIGLYEMLKSLKYQNIKEASDGLAALEYLANSEEMPKIVFLDIMMPRLDGMLLCEIMHKVDRWKNISIVLQSALTGLEDIQKGLTAGAVSYIQKPLSLGDLKIVMDDLFDSEVELDLPESIPPEMDNFVTKLVDSVKHTFNLTLGHKEAINVVNMGPLSASAAQATWEFVADIRSVGPTSVQISSGWTRAFGALVCEALAGIPQNELDTEFIVDMLQEFMNMIMGTQLRAVSDTMPAIVGLPSGGRDRAIPVDGGAKYKFAIEFQRGSHSFPLVVAML